MKGHSQDSNADLWMPRSQLSLAAPSTEETRTDHRRPNQGNWEEGTESSLEPPQLLSWGVSCHTDSGSPGHGGGCGWLREGREEEGHSVRL